MTTPPPRPRAAADPGSAAAVVILGCRPDLTVDQPAEDREAAASRGPGHQYGHGTVGPVAAATPALVLTTRPAPPDSGAGIEAGLLALTVLAAVALAAVAAAVAPRARGRRPGRAEASRRGAGPEPIVRPGPRA
ncbi:MULTISPECIES: hypothetical protein [Streptomycetaceae]|uniref:hypothetical protein n=1 Tax=Streptomycetaceae TaxID=2062 RepID=UPI00093F64C4|nr:hypothetical protein [Streptomyces sp. CB02056]OKI02906.1 hypothetical protein AMK13_30405 [Streptomyces sp. CB02056]